MKASSDKIITVIIAFFVGAIVAFAITKNNEPSELIVESEIIEETTEKEEEEVESETEEEPAEAEVAAPKTTTPAATTSTTTSTYSGGTCYPGVSGKKDSSFSAILLNWSPCANLDNFQFYKVVRSETNSNPSYPGSSVIFSSSNKSAASFIDKKVARAHTYHYRVCAVQRLGKTTCGNTATISY